MTTPDHPIDYVEYTSLSFPSDALTILALRRAHPDLFDVETSTNFFTHRAADHGPGTIIYLERLLARAAFETALGKPGDALADKNLDRDACLEDLTDLYSRYGLASGRHHTEQLVRTFEEQAAAQAAGPRRGG